MHHTQEVPAERVRRQLGLDEGAAVHDILRLRLVDGAPVSLHHSFVPVHIAPALAGEDLERQQLCVVLERDYGLRAHRTVEQLEAVPATEAEARLLDLRRGEPVLLLEDAISDRGGRVFEYSKILFRGDRMKLHFEFTN